MVYWRDWKKINISIVVSLPVECCVQNLCDSEWRWWKWKRWIWWDCDSKLHWGTQGRHHIFHVWRQHSNKYWHCTATHLKLVGPNYFTKGTMMYVFWLSGARKMFPRREAMGTTYQEMLRNFCWEPNLRVRFASQGQAQLVWKLGE